MKHLFSGLVVGLSALGIASATHAQTSPNVDRPPPNIANQRMSGPPASEGEARELVLRDGYTSVGPLTKGADGMWRGTAKRGDQELRVTVDTNGKVSP
ncbi:MAG: hypothetical protein AB7F22_18655 [Reyranella sp.]|uniref:hypothetical protein n=1 Tax=Reyranella sp. TaxID=1929291 RepID=UPI003D0F50AD